MTDLATRPATDEVSTDVDAPVEAPSVETPDADASDTTTPPPVEWAPAEPAPRRRRRWLWFAVPAAIAVTALVASSLVLIAPGTSVAGVSVGGLTPGAAADVLKARLAETTIVLSGQGGETELTAAELGATIDARALADEAFAAAPAWNIGAWNSDSMPAIVTIDPAVATEALRAAAPALYTDPVDATLAFDAATATYVVTPAVEGTGIDVDAIRSALQDAFAAGSTTVEIAAEKAPIRADTPTYVADATAKRLNGILATAGFYVGAERTVPLDPALAASWITVSPGERGTFDVTADTAAIQAVVDQLPAVINRNPVNSVTITNSAGEVLSTPTEGMTGRLLESTTGIADSFAKQLAEGAGAFQLPVTEVPFQTTALARSIEADLGQQMIFLKENGVVVDSWYVSSGTYASPTSAGTFTIGWKTPSQTMRGYEVDGNGNRLYDANGNPVMYETPNVKWAMYFNGDEAFHGVYWHDNFGSRMSHGCIGMPEWRAEQLYGWAPQGTDVWVHY